MKTSLTPDNSVRWDRHRLLGGLQGSLYIAPDAPDGIAQWLTSQPHPADMTYLDKGQFASAYTFDDGEDRLVLKQSDRQPWLRKDDWERLCGLEALKLNLALRQGLANIGDEAKISTGAQLMTPRYYGAFIGRQAARVVMSFEPGRHPDAADQDITGTWQERRLVLDAAVRSVGINPAGLEGYDNANRNMLLRDENTSAQVVLIDACNSQPLDHRSYC